MKGKLSNDNRDRKPDYTGTTPDSRGEFVEDTPDKAERKDPADDRVPPGANGEDF